MNWDEKIVKIQSAMGSGFVREWDVSRMKYSEKSNMICGIEKMFDQHYQMVKVPVYESEQGGKDKANVK